MSKIITSITLNSLNDEAKMKKMFLTLRQGITFYYYPLKIYIYKNHFECKMCSLVTVDHRVEHIVTFVLNVIQASAVGKFLSVLLSVTQLLDDHSSLAFVDHAVLIKVRLFFNLWEDLVAFLN